MCDKANIVVGEACIAKHLMILFKTTTEFAIVALEPSKVFWLDMEAQDVSLYLRWFVNDSRYWSKFLSKEGSILVITGQVFLPVLESHDAAGCEYASLTHIASDHFPENTGLLDVFFTAYNHTANRTAQALA